MPPSRSLSVGLTSRFSSVWPCAVAISCTPRSAIVRAANASASVPISSMTMTCGMWFSTASIITLCCSAGSATCMRRECPMPGCGTSPSPAISFDVSTMTTRLRSSASTRAHSRSIVVLPTPGRPEQADRLAAADHVEDDVDRAVHRAADAARQADDPAGAIADRADAVQRLLDAGPVVGAERREPRSDVRDIFRRHRGFAQRRRNRRRSVPRGGGRGRAPPR